MDESKTKVQLLDIDLMDHESVIEEMGNVLERIPESYALYRNELEKLMTAYTKSQESEQRLVTRTKEIINDIRLSRETIFRDQQEENEANTLKQKTLEDIQIIKQQIDASRQVERGKEAKVKELNGILCELQEDIAKLVAMETSAEGTEDLTLNEQQKQQISTLKGQRAECANELSAKRTQLAELRQETSNIYAQVLEEERCNSQMEEARDEIELKIRQKVKSAEKAARRKTLLEKELKNLKQVWENLQEELVTKENMKTADENILQQKETTLRESKQKMEKYIKQYDQLYRNTQSLTEAMQGQWQKNVDVHKNNVQIEQELKQRESGIHQQSQEVAKVEKLTLIAKEQIAEIDRKEANLESEKEQLRFELNQHLANHIDVEKKQADILTKKLDEMVREREVLNKMLVKSNDRSQMTFDLMKVKENTQKNLENEINGIKTSVKKQRVAVQKLVEERENYKADAERLHSKLKSSLEESKLQDLQVMSLHQKIQDAQSRLKQQQTLYESVRKDRNLYSKQLLEAQEEIHAMKRKFKILHHQIEQLKEEITSKDHSLVKEHFEHHKVDKEKEILKNELLRIKKHIQSSEQIIGNQEVEISKLSKIIQEAEDEKIRQNKDLKGVVHDRDTLQQQLLARNKELQVLYEKITIQKSTLLKGYSQYEEKKKLMKSLQQRIQLLSFERDASSRQLSHEGSLKKELVNLEKQLTQERLKIRALSEELDHPLNVHRWRKLEGSEPKKYEMIRKIHGLQRKLLKAFDETMTKDLLILEKEKLYVELKNILQRQPGAEVVEQLVVYKETLKGKNNQIKEMKKELKLYKSQVVEYRYEQEKIEREKKQIIDEWVNKNLSSQRTQHGNNSHYDDDTPIIDESAPSGTYTSDNSREQYIADYFMLNNDDLTQQYEDPAI